MLLLLTLALVLAGQPKDGIPRAQAAYQRGNYAEARAGYEALLKDKNPAAGGIRWPGALLARRGEVFRGTRRARHRAQGSSRTTRLFSRTVPTCSSRLAGGTMRRKDAEAAIKKQDANFLARWVRVRLLRDKGDIAAADKEVRWFVRTYSDASAAGKDIADAGIAAPHRPGRRRERPLEQQADAVRVHPRTRSCKDALKADPDCWQAEVQAGFLLLEKHNRADAADAFDKALKINPQAVEALVGKGMLALAELDTPAAGRMADRALEGEPETSRGAAPEGRRPSGRGRSRLRRAPPPRRETHQPARGGHVARLAALHLPRANPRRPPRSRRRSPPSAPSPASFHHELAEVLVARRSSREPRKRYKKAMELRPDLSGPAAGLGLLHMQLGPRTGSEAATRSGVQGRPVPRPRLERAQGPPAISMATRRGRRRTSSSSSIPRPIASSPRGWRTTSRGCTPSSRSTTVSHRRARSSSRSWHPARCSAAGSSRSPGCPAPRSGASTGPLIALPSPRADGMARPYNWAVVVRHELTHAFNLTQTGFLVPIWLTEGLAVRAEGTRSGSTPLKAFFATGSRMARAFTSTRSPAGYHNFGNPQDVMLAYHQGFLYVEYIESTHGEEAVAEIARGVPPRPRRR